MWQQQLPLSQSSDPQHYVSMDDVGTTKAVIDLIFQERERYRQIKTAQKKWTVAIVAVSVTAICSSLWVLALGESSLFTILAVSLSFVTAPYVIYQRRRLQAIPTLVHVTNGIRQHANTLLQQNQTLECETQRLEEQVRRLQEAETSLERIAVRSQSNVDHICQLVADNADILRQMKHLANARELQHILTAILQSDLDGNHVLSESELDILMFRLESFSAVDANKIRMALSQSGSTTSLYKIAASESYGEDHAQTYGAGRILQWLLDDGA